HDALRLRFICVDGQWQAEHQEFNAQMLNDTLGEISLAEEDFDTLEIQANDYQASLSLEHGPLFRAVYCTDSKGQSRLLLIIHHLLVDGVSWRVLTDDLERMYQQHIDDKPPVLLPKSTSYQAWGDFLGQYSQSPSLMAEKEYWHNVLKTPVPNPIWIIENAEANTGFSSAEFTLDNNTTTQLLTDAQKAYKTQINELLLSALLLGFYEWSGHKSIRLDLEGHGRQELDESLDLSQTVGWFTTLFPLTLSSDSMDFESLICAVKEQHRAVPNQGIGFAILKYLSEDKDLCDTDISPILFNYLGRFSGEKDDNRALSFASENIGSLISPLRQPEHGLNFNGSVMAGCLSFTVDYDQSLYSRKGIKQLLKKIKAAIVNLVAHCLEDKTGCLTPADFPLARIEQAQLNQWQKQYSIADIYPATAMQQGLLFHSAIDKSAYISQFMFTLETGVDINAFRWAWQQVLNRHAILRTIFVPSTSGALQQLVIKNVMLSWTEGDLKSLEKDNQAQHLESARQLDKALGFEIEQGPLLRIKVWHLGQGQYKILLSNHHALTDGWSLPLIFSEVVDYYRTRLNGEQLLLEDAEPYRNYIQWLTQQDSNKAINFWKSELAGVEGPTFIVEKQEPDQKKQITHQLLIDKTSTSELQQLAKDSRVTVNSLLQAAWAYLLSRYSNQSTVVFGTTVSGRPADLKNVERMVGLFINTIPVRIDIPIETPFEQWLKTLHAKQVERNEYSYLPLVEIQCLSDCNNDVQLIDNLFVFENYPLVQIDTNSEQNQLAISDHIGYEEINYTLGVSASISDRLKIKFSGKSSHFSKASLTKVSQHFETILAGIIENPLQKVTELPMLSVEETSHLLHTLNATQVDYPTDLCIHELFEQKVDAAPDSLAMVFANQSLNYSELNAKANQLAHYLLEQGAQPDNLIGICIERSMDMIVAILATLKAGAAYLPLDPAYPLDRLKYMLEDSRVELILSQEHLLNDLKIAEQRVILIDDPSLFHNYSVANISRASNGLTVKHLAYLIYTSGSTGQPKGVMIEHRSVLNLAQYQRQHFSIKPHNSVLQFASINFDAATSEWVMALLSGASLYICDQNTRQDAKLLENYLCAHALSHVTIPPALLKLMDCERNYNFEALLVAGEDFDQELSKKWGAKYKFYNGYGPSETTVCGSISAPLCQQRLNIGKQMSNSKMYILDEQQRLLPHGVTGELYISGDSLARGYLNQPELTAEKFIANPFSNKPTDRMYKTGDLVRYLKDNTLEFIGRVDDQVKIRGFRVELGEIEHQLMLHENISSVVVMLREDTPLNKQLVAYITQNSLADESSLDDSELIEQLRSHLQSTVPDYMVPSFFVLLDEIPLNPNGKIDRKALVAPDSSLLQDEYIAPQDKVETSLSYIWANLLNLAVTDISTNANFFELGGHSLLLTRMLHLIAEQLETQLPIKSVFEAPTIQQMALLIKQEAMSQSILVRADSQGPRPLSFAQYRVWFIEQLKDHTNEHNMAAAVQIKGDFKPTIMQAALNAMIAQHEILRTRIVVINDEPQQIVEDEYIYTLPIKDLRSLDKVEQQQQVNQLSYQHDTQVFDLSQLPLLAALVIQTSDDEFLLHFNHHHIISDGWSQQLFYSQLMGNYQSLLKGDNSNITTTNFHYSDYAHWQQKFLQSDQAEEQKLFWQEYLTDCNEHLSLPIEKNHSDFDARQNQFSANTDLAVRDQLKTIAHAHQGSLFNVLHSAFALLISRLSGESDFNIGLPVTGRHIYGTQDMLGMFLNNLPIRHQLDLNMSYSSLLKQQINNVNQVLSNQDIPFENILEITGCERSVDNTPLFQILFNMISLPEGDIESMDLDFAMQGRSTAEIENKFNMTLYLADTEGGIVVNCHYNSSLYDGRMIEQLLNQYTYLLSQIAQNSELNCTAYSLNTQPCFIEYDLPIQRYHGTDVTALFRDQAALNPAAIAIIDGKNQWTYQQLLSASQEIAIKLQANDIGCGDVVTIMASRHASLIIAIMGVLQTGAAYSIVVADNPEYQISQHLKMVDATVMLLCEQDNNYSDTLLKTLSEQVNILEVSNRTLYYTTDTTSFTAYANQPQQAACITFTSGSAGTPKGVIGTHAGLSGYLQWWPEEFNITAKDRFSLLSGLSHDPLQRDIFGALCLGACLLIPDEQDFATYRFSDWLKEQAVSIMHLTPAMAEVMSIEGIQQTHSLKTIFLTGEALRADIVQNLRGFNTQIQLINCYGATESQRALTYHRLAENKTLSLITPIAVSSRDTRLRLINAQGMECGVGELGEIIIESAQLAKGYLNDRELTAQRFANTGSDIGSYKTGDLGVYLDNERIHYFGRSDSQVNIRGYRVELG
ncbi:MAG: amino acid adenylation domain-containing protein, partial [Alcanivoracaceae bacterium]|nr:amino acid adenylation domain-containing protein [Alcanivoracaceae bacterium]